MDREQYEKDLKERQEKHLREVAGSWSPCAHDACTECHGTGIRRTGGACIHALYCSCPKCAAFC